MSLRVTPFFIGHCCAAFDWENDEKNVYLTASQNSSSFTSFPIRF